MSAYFKAIVGALAAGLGSLAASLDAGSLTAQSYIYAAITALVALGAIYVVPNQKKSG